MELKKAINVTLVYIAWILAGYYIKFIGIPSLYSVSIWIVPFYNFLAIKNSLASPKSPIFTIPLWIGIVGVTTHSLISCSFT